MRLFLITSLSLLLAACSGNPQSPQSGDIQQTAEDYFSVYADRTDFERFMAFYADDAVLEDIVYGDHLKNKEEIYAFLDWNKGNVERLDDGKALTVLKQVIEGNTVVTEGYFHSFKYGDKIYGPWRFLIWLEVNQEGKISRHVDWINYMPREDFLGGSDMNTLLPPAR